MNIDRQLIADLNGQSRSTERNAAAGNSPPGSAPFSKVLADIAQGRAGVGTRFSTSSHASLTPSSPQPRTTSVPPNDNRRGSEATTVATARSVVVREGDTLAAIAARALRTIGAEASPSAAWRGAIALARANVISNPDRIYPGQVISLDAIESSTLASRTTASPLKPLVESPRQTEAPTSPLEKEPGALANPLLEKTLQRAVSLNYLTPEEKDAVRGKILQLATDHRFKPDDLALVSLMESDGFNPRASNGRCFGVIQFCDGPDRGAASVGYRDAPKAITGLPVLEQLDLVSRYFSETGLRDFGRAGKASLDDLYLTVLTPAARSDRRTDSPLPIQGTQASVLKVDGNPQGPITRRSLVQGLWQTARDKLAAVVNAPADAATRGDAGK